MERLLKNRSLLNKLGRNAKIRVGREFGANLLTDMWLKFYKKNLR